MIVKIPRAYIHALSSDLLEGKVRLVFQMPLNTETMQLREQIAMLKILDTAVTLDITSPQGMLGESDAGSFKQEFQKAASDIYSKSVIEEDSLAGESLAEEPLSFRSVRADKAISQMSKAARRVEEETRAANARNPKKKGR